MNEVLVVECALPTEFNTKKNAVFHSNQSADFFKAHGKFLENDKAMTTRLLCINVISEISSTSYRLIVVYLYNVALR